jgi:hypothetical protein
MPDIASRGIHQVKRSGLHLDGEPPLPLGEDAVAPWLLRPHPVLKRPADGGPLEVVTLEPMKITPAVLNPHRTSRVM